MSNVNIEEASSVVIAVSELEQNTNIYRTVKLLKKVIAMRKKEEITWRYNGPWWERYH